MMELGFFTYLMVLLVVVFLIPTYLVYPEIFKFSFSWVSDIVNYNNPDYKQRKKLLSTARSVIDKMDDEYDFDEITTMLDGESEDSLISIEEKVKVLRANSEEELNAQWKRFKSRKSRNYYYQAGEIVSIEKKKIKAVRDEFQIKVFYREAIITAGKEKPYQQHISNIDKLKLYTQLEEFVEQLEDEDEDLEKILKRFQKFESLQFIGAPAQR